MGEKFLKEKEVGIIGLGAGASHCLFDNNQKITYYEIDPVVANIATNDKFFTFLSQCSPHYKVDIGGARIRINSAQKGQYTMLVLDAFSSDSIPVHLLTKEAFKLYLDKLSDDGVLMVHISNRHLRLEPVVVGIADALNLSGAFYYYNDPKEADILSTSSVWAMLTKNKGLLPQGNGWESINKTLSDIPVWTDSYSSILHILK